MQHQSLGLRDQLGDEDGDFLLEVLRRQAFNYNPVVTPDPNATLQNLQFSGNANLSFIWWCGMVDAETVQMRVTWNDEVFELKDAEVAMDRFDEMARQWGELGQDRWGVRSLAYTALWTLFHYIHNRAARYGEVTPKRELPKSPVFGLRIIVLPSTGLGVLGGFYTALITFQGSAL